MKIRLLILQRNLSTPIPDSLTGLWAVAKQNLVEVKDDSGKMRPSAPEDEIYVTVVPLRLETVRVHADQFETLRDLLEKGSGSLEDHELEWFHQLWSLRIEIEKANNKQKELLREGPKK